jgi:hypothetical protein
VATNDAHTPATIGSIAPKVMIRDKKEVFMSNAESKNLETSKPFTDEELRSIGERIQKGSLVIMKRPPWSCVCGNEIRDLKYIGDTSGLAEWEFTCDKCGEVFCS